MSFPSYLQPAITNARGGDTNALAQVLAYFRPQFTRYLQQRFNLSAADAEDTCVILTHLLLESGINAQVRNPMLFWSFYTQKLRWLVETLRSKKEYGNYSLEGIREGQESDSDYGDWFADPASNPANAIEHAPLYAAISQLPQQWHEVIVRFYFEEKSIQEIATETGIPQGTIKSNLCRARQKLKTLLEQQEFLS